MSIAFAPALAPRLDESRHYCEQLTQRAARNFYYGLKLLPEPKRSAMFAVYAYMRLVDDIADEDDGRPVSARRAALEQWRARTHAALEGRQSEDDDSPDDHPVWPAFAATARRYRIPAQLFDDAISGQRQDLEPVAFDTFEPLCDYCYRVAGVVGLASIHVWGFDGGSHTESLAIDRGIAFQLTNVLRDLREDAGRGRVYLPREELAAFGVEAEDLGAGRGGPKFREMMRFQIDRARRHYEQSAALERRVTPDSRPTLVTMTEIYRKLLEKIAADPERVLNERVSLSMLSKLRIGWRAIRDQ